MGCFQTDADYQPEKKNYINYLECRTWLFAKILTKIEHFSRQSPDAVPCKSWSGFGGYLGGRVEHNEEEEATAELERLARRLAISM